MKTIHFFANICSQILTTASQIGVKMAEVAPTWSMDTAVCVKQDTQALTAKQVKLIINHSFINSLYPRPMFVLVSLFLVCLAVFLLFFPAEYHNVLICFTLCGPLKTYFWFSGCLSYLFLFKDLYVWYEKSH